jgi:predicted  nucleic acid-binding Zn-ribbon protein
MKTAYCLYCGEIVVVTNHTVLAICTNPGCKKMFEVKESK